MDTKAYLKALKKLGLTPHGKRTAEVLGMSLSGVQKIAMGHVPVPRPAELLLALYLQHGLPEEEAA